MAELSDVRCVLIDPNKSTEVERLIYRYYPIFYSGYVNSSNEVIFLAWDNIDKKIKVIEKLTLDIMYFPDMEASKVAQPYLIKKSQLNIPTEWGQPIDLSNMGYTKKSSLIYTDINTIKKTYPKPIDFDTEESFYGTGQGGFTNGLEPFAFYGYASFDIFKTKNEFNKYKIYMNYEKNLNNSSLIHYECTCPTAKSPIIINLSSNDSITDNDEQNKRACLKALEICNKGTCQTNETLPHEKLDLSIRECHDINSLMDQNIKIPCESTLSETPEHTIKGTPEITTDAVPESTNNNADAENTIKVLPENTKSAVTENTKPGTAAVENNVNNIIINENFANINSTTTEWLDENNNKYYRSVSVTAPFSTTGLWFQNIVKRNITVNKQGGFLTFKLLCLESWDAISVVNLNSIGENIKIQFNSVTLFDFSRNFGSNYTFDIQKNIAIGDKNIKFSFKSNDDFSLWTTNTGRPAIATTWYSQSFNVRIDYPPYAFNNIELLLDGAFDEGFDNESVAISDFQVTQNENTIDEVPEATTEVPSEVTNAEQPEVTTPGNVEATRVDIPENTKPLIPASNIVSLRSEKAKYATKAYNYSLTKCLYFDNFEKDSTWKNAVDNSIYANYMNITNPAYGRKLLFLTHDLYKDYAINNNYSYDISMEIFFVESWDSESYIIKINGTNAVALSKPHQAGINNTSGTATIGGINIPWTFESKNDNFNWVCTPEYGNGFNSLSGIVKFKIPTNFGTNIRLGVTTTLDQVISDECACLGNVYIFENVSVSEPQVLEDIRSTSSELSYDGKPEVTIDKIDKYTVNGTSETTTNAIPENTKNLTPENTIASVPENTKTFDCKDYQHCGEVLSPEVIEKTIAEIPEETQYKNETTTDAVPESTTPGTLEGTVDSIVEKTTDAVPENTTPYVPPVITTAYVPESTTYTPILTRIDAKSFGYDDVNRVGGIYKDGINIHPTFVRGICINIFDANGGNFQGGGFDTYISAAEDVRLINFLNTIKSINNTNNIIVMVTSDDWVNLLSQTSRDLLKSFGFDANVMDNAEFRSSYLGVSIGNNSGGWSIIHSSYQPRYSSVANTYTTTFNTNTTSETTVDTVPEVTTAEKLSVQLSPLVPENTTPLVPEKTTDAVPENTKNGSLENTVYNMDTVKKNDTSVEFTAPKIDENTIDAKPEDTIQLSDCDNIEKQCEYTIDENPEDTIYGTPEITIPEITTAGEPEKVLKPFVPESTNNKMVETTLDGTPESTTPGTPEGSVQYIPEGTVPYKAESTVDVPPVPDTTQIKVNEMASGSNNQLAGGFLCKVEGLSTVNAFMDPYSVPDQFTIYGIKAGGGSTELLNQTWGGSTRNVTLNVSGYTHLNIKVNKDGYQSGTAFRFSIQGDATLVKPGVGSETTTPAVPEVSQAEVPEVTVPLVPENTIDEIPEDTVNTPVEVTIDEIQEGTLPEIPESTTPAHILEMGSEDYVIHAQTPEITNTFPCDDDMCEETINGTDENTVKETPEITTLAIPENTIYARNEEIELVEDTRNEIIESNNGVVANRTSIENTTEVDKRYATKYKDTKGNEDYYSSLVPLPSSYYYFNDNKLSLQEVLNIPYLNDKICIENTVGDIEGSFEINICTPENTRTTTIQYDELTIDEVPEETKEAVAGRIITLGVPENTKYVPCENQRICEDTIPEQEEDTVTIIPGEFIAEVPENTIPGTPAVFEPYKPERTSDAVTPIYIPEIPENTVPYVPAIYIPAVTENTLDPVDEVTLNSTPEDTTPKVPAVYIPLVPENTAPYIPEKTTDLVPAVNIPAVPENTTPLVPESTTPLVPEATTPQTESTVDAVPAGTTQISLNQTINGSNNSQSEGFICKVAGLSTASVYMDPYGAPDQFTVYGITASGVSTQLFNNQWSSTTGGSTVNFDVSNYENLQVKVNKDRPGITGTAFQFRINGNATLVTTASSSETTTYTPESTTPLVPESTVPLVPAVTISNYVPETTLAEIPESTTPEVLENTIDQVPETTIPEIPEVTYDAVPEDTTPYKSEVILIPGTNEITTEAVDEATKDAIPEITRDGSSSTILVPEVPENTLPAIPPRIISDYIPEKTVDETIIKPFKSIPEYTVPAMDERTINEIPENTIPAVPSSIIPKIPESTVSKVPETTTTIQVVAKYIAYDNLSPANPFIAAVEDGLGKVLLDGGFPKWYNGSCNTGWTAYSQMTGSYKYLFDALNYISNPSKVAAGNKKILIIGDAEASENYSIKSTSIPLGGFNTSINTVCNLAGYIPTFKTRSDYGTQIDCTSSELDQYVCVLFFSTVYTSAKLITDNAIQSLINYRKNNNGIFIITDHGDNIANIADATTATYTGFFRTANHLVTNFGCYFTGNYDRTPVNVGFLRTTYGSHPLWKNLADSESIHAGGSESKVVIPADKTIETTVAEIPEKTIDEVPEKVIPAIPPKYVTYLVPEVTTHAKPESTSPRINPTFLKEYKPESTKTFTCPSIERVANLDNTLDAILDNTKHLNFLELKQPIGFDNKLIVEVHIIYDSMLYFDRDEKINLSFYYYSHDYNTITIKPTNTSNLIITPMDEILVYEFKLPNDNEMSSTPKIGVYASVTKNREYDWQPYKELLTVYDKQEIYIPWKLQGTEYNIYYPSSSYSTSMVDSNIIEDSYNPFELLVEKDVINILDKYNNNLVSDITNAFNVIFETEIPSEMLNYLFDLFMNNPANLDSILEIVQLTGVSVAFEVKTDYKDVDKSFFNVDKTREVMISLASNSAFDTDNNNRNKFIKQPKQYMLDVLLNENPRTDLMLQERIDIPYTDYVLARFNIFGNVQILTDNVNTFLGKNYIKAELYSKYGKKYGDGNTYRFFNGNIQMLDIEGGSFKFVDIPFIQDNYNIYKLIRPEYSRSKILPVQKLLNKEINQIIEPRFSFLNTYANNNRKLSFELTRFMNTAPYAYKLVYKSPRVNLQQNNLMSNHISLTYDNPFYSEFYELAGTTNTGNNITGNQKIYTDVVYGQVPFGFIETIMYHEPFKHQIEIPDIYDYIKFLFEKIIQYKPSAEILKEIYDTVIDDLKTDYIGNPSNMNIFAQCQKYILNYLDKFNFILLDNINEGIITVNNFYTILVQKLKTYKDYSIEMFNSDVNVINYWTRDKARQEHNNYKDKTKQITLDMNNINIDACLEYLDSNKLNTNTVVNIPMDNVITTKDNIIVGYFVLYLYYYFPNNPIGFKYRRIPTLIQESGNIHKIANDFTTNLTEFKVI